MISDDEYLERVVAGIHAVTTEEADVTWNEKINGRQFDVVVRFKAGTLCYLVLVEVRNRTRKAEACHVEAFVTKARDQNANKAVFVTVAGFQDGAIEVAKRHGVDLFTVKFSDVPRLSEDATLIAYSTREGQKEEAPAAIEIGEPHLIAKIEKVQLLYVDGKIFDVPNEQSQMTYYCRKTKFVDGRSLDDLLPKFVSASLKQNQSYKGKIHFNHPEHIEPPDPCFFPAGSIIAIEYTATGRLGRPIKGNIMIDPGVFNYKVFYTNAMRGKEHEFLAETLPIGDKELRIGSFYFTPHPISYFFCDDISDNIATMLLIESFQNGEIFTANCRMAIKESPRYIPVTDKDVLKRLRYRLQEFRSSRAIS